MATDENGTVAFDAALRNTNPEYYVNPDPEVLAAGTIPYEKVVDALTARVEKRLRSEAIVGQTSHVTGKADIRIDELRGRLARLNANVVICETVAGHLLKDRPTNPDIRALAQHMKRVVTLLKTPSFESMRPTTINRRLPVMLEALSDALDVVDSVTSKTAEQIDPGKRLVLLTAEEVEAIYKPTNQTERFATLLRLGDGLRKARSETRELLAGGFGGPKGQPGRHERRRGRELAAFLLGTAVGMGLAATRNDNKSLRPAYEKSFRSACDAVNDAKSRLPRSPDPAAAALLAEVPDGYDGQKAVWKMRASDEKVGDAVGRGFMVGERLRFKVVSWEEV